MPPRDSNRLFTFDELTTVEQMWNDGATRAQIADAVGVQIWVLDERRRDQLRHLPKERGRNGGRYCRKSRRGDPDPSPEEMAEIEARRLEVQSWWTEEVRISRIQGAPCDRVVQRDAIRAAIRDA